MALRIIKKCPALIFGILFMAALHVDTNDTNAQTLIKLGVLNCNVAGGWGQVLGSKKEMTCVYEPAGGGVQEKYAGVIRRYGLDIGKSEASVVVWGVVAPTPAAEGLPSGALAGNYGGVGAQVALGLGVGAKALVGGFKDSIALQPFSVQGEQGTNIAAGVETLELRYIGAR